MAQIEIPINLQGDPRSDRARQPRPWQALRTRIVVVLDGSPISKTRTSARVLKARDQTHVCLGHSECTTW